MLSASDPLLKLTCQKMSEPGRVEGFVYVNLY